MEPLCEDLCSRFVLELPESEKTPARFVVHLREAHWFYLDFLAQKHPVEKWVGCRDEKVHENQAAAFKHFAHDLLWFLTKRGLTSLCPNHLTDYLAANHAYMKKIPVCGAVVVSTDHRLLLVRGLQCQNWGFPKGKTDYNETPLDCAIREVEEETGWNIRRCLQTQAHTEARGYENELSYQRTPTQKEELSYQQTPTQKEELSYQRTPTHKEELSNQRTPTHKEELSNQRTPTQRKELKNQRTPTQKKEEEATHEPWSVHLTHHGTKMQLFLVTGFDPNGEKNNSTLRCRGEIAEIRWFNRQEIKSLLLTKSCEAILTKHAQLFAELLP